MKKLVKTLTSRYGTINPTATSTSILFCSLLMATASAYAESSMSQTPSYTAFDTYPLLAEYREDEREYDRRRNSGRSERHQESDRNRKTRDRRERDSRDGYRAGPRHQQQRQPRYRHFQPGATPAPAVPPKHADLRRRTYSTESRHHPHYPNHRPPGGVYPKHHHPRDRVVVRPFRYVVPRHRHHRNDGNIWGLLTFTAITLAILDNLNDQQQREHELAVYDATTTPIGETIHWHEGDASGAVTTTREGTSSTGRYCREYVSEVTIGGRQESVYGTACQQPDGSWEIEQ